MSSENNSSSGSKKKKIVAAAIAVALAAALMIGGTISYLVSSSGTIVNTFSTPTIDVNLVETTEGYTIIPGTSEEKDPTVKITTGVDAYVYLVVEDSTDGLVTYTINEAWTLLSTEENDDGSITYVYYMEVSASSKRQSIDCLEGQTVYYSSAITNEDVEDYESGDLTLSFTAYAIQKASFSSAEEAYPYAIGTSVAVDSADELTAALADTDVTYIVVTSDITLTVNASDGTSGSLTTYLTVSSDTTLDLGDYTLSFDTSGLTEEELGGSLAGTPVLITVSSGTLTINSGTFDCSIGDNGAYAINVNGGSLVINGGTFYGAPSAVQVQSGTASIYGGTFDFTDACKESQYFSSYTSNYLLNCLDSAYSGGTASITVYGGTYVSFNPASNGAEGSGTSFVANGYTVTSSTNDDGEAVYTVSAGSSSSE